MFFVDAVAPLRDTTGATDPDAQAFTVAIGVVTLLVCDIDPAALCEAPPDAMARALPRYHALLAGAVNRHRGTWSAIADGASVICVFSRVSDALTAALDAQHAFAIEPWPDEARLAIRLAAHTGEVELRNNHHDLGRTLVKCRRMLATGSGGQILVSDTTAALAADGLPEGASLVDLGAYRLHDHARRQHLWQLVHPTLPSALAPVRSLDTSRNNLPLQLTSLIGRATATREVVDLLSRDRLVTLTGAGGVGKTRLALATAADAADTFSESVWWVDLAPLSDPDETAGAVLASMGLPHLPGPAATHVAAEIGEDNTLLVLDNCEHLIEGCALFVAEVLTACPAANVLATSREPLGIPGETTYRVPSLSAPTPEQGPDRPALLQFDAVRLFVERARHAQPSFTLTDDNAPAIAEICHRLDGIPLAIELAAARCRQSDAQRISRALDDRFRILTGGPRTATARQQTLRASIDWSYELLTDVERTVYWRLGVFAGSFPIEAAESVVAAAGDLAPTDVFHTVSHLVECSLLTSRENGTRYRLLETLRAYAIERATAAGEVAALRDAHAAWLADWLDQLDTDLASDDVVEQVDELHDDLMAALHWSTRNVAMGLHLLSRVARPWLAGSRPFDALAVADRLLLGNEVDEAGATWLEAARRWTEIYAKAGREQGALTLVERIQHVAQALGDSYALAEIRSDSGGLAESQELVAEARRAGDRYMELQALTWLSIPLRDVDPAAARLALAEADAIAAYSASSELQSQTLMAHAHQALIDGDLAACHRYAVASGSARSGPAEAEALMVRAAAAFLGADRPQLVEASAELERLAGRRAGYASYASLGRHRLQLLDGGPSEVAIELQNLALGALSDPTTLWYWITGREAIDTGESRLAAAAVRQLIHDRPAGIATAALVEAAATGDEARWHDALNGAARVQLRLLVVDALEGLATATSLRERWGEAVRLLGAADRLRAETGYKWRFPFEQRAFEQTFAGATRVLGDSFDAMLAEGRRLEWREAVAYASRGRGARLRPRAGWDSLTDTENLVVALVAQGLTNPQIAARLIMSRATVKTHLEHIFLKLGVRTRSQLAAQAAQRPPAIGR